jgi:uncharacterized protein (DUF2236 family)
MLAGRRRDAIKGPRRLSEDLTAYFLPDSIVRRIHGERVVGLAGPRALLMQAAHPLAVSGLLAHSSTLDEPYERLARTAQVMNAIVFGPREEADRLTAAVRAMHRRVSGRLPAAVGPYPAGTPYRADDPALLMWVLFTLVDSSLLVYRRYVGSLTRREEERYWHEYKTVGRLFGLTDGQMPHSLAELDAYRERMLDGDELHVTEWAQRRARQIVLEPPVPVLARPVLETVNFLTIALLPEPIRSQYGFSPIPPVPLRRALTTIGAEYLKRAVLPLLPAHLRLVPAARA